MPRQYTDTQLANADANLDSTFGEIFNKSTNVEDNADDMEIIDVDSDSNGDEVNYDFSTPTIDEKQILDSLGKKANESGSSNEGSNEGSDEGSKQSPTKELPVKENKEVDLTKENERLEAENVKLTALNNVYKEKLNELTFKYSLLQEKDKKVSSTADAWLQDDSERIQQLEEIYKNTYAALDYKLIEDIVTDTDLSTSTKRQSALRNGLLEAKYQFDSVFGKSKLDIARAKIKHIVSKNNLKPVIERKVLDYFEQKFYNSSNREDSSAIDAVLRRSIPELGKDISKYSASIKVKQAQKPDSEKELELRALQEENRLLKLRGTNTTASQDNETNPRNGKSFNSDYLANTAPQFSKQKQTNSFNGRSMASIAGLYEQP
jgi:hypothetical protein